MKKIYALLILSFCLVAGLIAFAFLFFEKEKHALLYYEVKQNERNAGYIKIDRYRTEDMIIYKSISLFPKDLNNKIVREKLSFDRKTYRFKKFTKGTKNFGTVGESVYIKNNDNETYDFLAKSQSKFSYLGGIEHAKNILLFNENSLVSYMPIVDKYDLAHGRAQAFNVIYPSFNLLPSAVCNVIFTSIRDEYIYIEGKRLKTEVLLVRSKVISPCYIWVSKKSREIVQLESKQKSLFIKKVSFPQRIEANHFTLADESYTEHDVIIPSGDIALAGTMAIPKKTGKLPAVLLVSGGELYDRQEAGLFAYISDALAKEGKVVLCYDRRGVGKSQGDNSAVGLDNETGDISNALNFLLNHERVDADKVFILAHGESCSYLPELDYSKYRVRGLLMLGILRPEPIMDFENDLVSEKIETLSAADKKYEGTLSGLTKKTLSLVKDAKKDYAYIDGDRVFLRRMTAILKLDPVLGFSKIDVPLLIIQGKKDRLSSPSYLGEVEDVISKSESSKAVITYFRNENRFFGEIEETENIVTHYRVNKEVLETVTGWVGEKCADLLPETDTEFDKIESL